MMSQSVYNIMHSVEAVRIWKKHPLLQWYKEKVEGHQRHAFRNYLLTVYKDKTSKPESELMRILRVEEVEEIVFHANKQKQLPIGLGPVPKKYYGPNDDTPQHLDSDEDDTF